MANEIKKGTIYQQLNQMLNLDGMGFQDAQPSISASSPSKETKVIIKGNSPEEIHRKGLELEQKRELQNKFFRTTDRGFQKALQYEAARLPLYIDVEGFENYPLVAAALDLFMEEATTIGSNGKMLNIYSNKERIKTLLEEFFYDTINVNVNLPFWTRNMPVKYDSMIPLLTGEIVSIKEVANRLKEHPEKEIWTYSIQNNTNTILPGKIIWCDLTRENTQILKINLDDGTYVETTPDHEFLLRDGSFKRADELETGVSLMPFYTIISKEANKIKGYEKIYDPKSNKHKFTHRIVVKDCIINLNEESKTNDMYVTHHINFNKLDNSPSNLIRMSNSEHSEYHNKLGERGTKTFKRPDVVKKRMRGIDKYLRSDSRRKRLSKEMSGKYPEYFNVYNNSELHSKHNTIRKNKMLNLWSNEEYKSFIKEKMRLHLSDDALNYIIATIKKHEYYLSSIKLSHELKNDEDFMILFKASNDKIRKNLKKSLNSKTLRTLILRKLNLRYCDFIVQIKPDLKNDAIFKKACNISKKRTILNHKIVSIEYLEDSFDAYCMEVVGPNNEQDRHNFPICSKNSNGEYCRNGVFVSNCKYGDNFVLLYGEKGDGITHVKQLVNYEIERLEKIQNGKPIVNFKERMTGDMFNSFEIAHFRLLGDDKFIPYGCSILSKVRRTVRELILVEDAMLTYRLVRAGEKKVFKIDVGNIDDDDVEEYITKVATKFKKVSQVSQNNGQIDYRYNPVGNDEDYFIPQRNANVQTGVETLPGASNLSDIGDIEYLRDNLLVALGIPRPFLSMQDAAGGGKNLAQFDIRFAKKVSRIQQAMIQELNKMAIIHLYLLGYSGEDLKDFTLTLTNPSTQQELLKSELMRDKAQTYTELTRTENGIAAMSHVEAQRLIFNKSDREIVEGLKQQKMERVVMQELQDSPIIIKKSGLFKSLDDKYGEPIEGMPLNTTPEAGNAQGGSLPGGGAPMQNLGGPEIGGGELPGTSTGGAPNMGGNLGGGEAGAPIAESKSNKKLSDEDYTNLLEKMVGIDSSKIRVKQENKKIIIENNKINDDLNKDAMSMISEIDEILKDNNNLNTNQRLDESEDVDLSIIED